MTVSSSNRRQFSSRFAFWMCLGPGAIFLVVFVVAPMSYILLASFWRTESFEMIRDWNFENYRRLLTDPTYLTFLRRSAVMAVGVTLAALVYSWPIAYFIAFSAGRYRLILILLTSAPFFTGIVLRVTALQQILGPIGVLNLMLGKLGIEPFEALLYSRWATGIGLFYLWTPFMILAIYLSLLNFDFDLVDAARVNGAGPLRAFWEVTFPLNWIGTSVGIVLVLIPSLAAAVTPRFLGGPNGSMYGNILANQFGSTGTWALGSAMGVVLMAVSAILVIIVFKSVSLERSGFSGS